MVQPENQFRVLRHWRITSEHGTTCTYDIAFRGVVVDTKALKSVLVDMVKPVISVLDANGVTLSQKIFFDEGMKQSHHRDSSVTLTLKEYYDVAIKFAQSIPHQNSVGIKLFYTSSEQQAEQGNGTGNSKGGKGSKGGNGNGGRTGGRGSRPPTLDGTMNTLCLFHLWNKEGCNRKNTHCNDPSADKIHPKNRMGTGVLYAEKAKWQTCTFKDCKRGRCIYKHGTGDEQISDHGHDPNKPGLKSNQTVVQNNTTTANGAQNQAPPQGRWRQTRTSKRSWNRMSSQSWRHFIVKVRGLGTGLSDIFNNDTHHLVQHH
jgi:hypothetical protein